MSDCECEKNKTRDNWIDDGDYGDNFLREDSFNVIDKIKRGLTYYGFNEIKNDTYYSIKDYKVRDDIYRGAVSKLISTPKTLNKLNTHPKGDNHAW